MLIMCRYLIVIDDLWDTAVWDFLSRAFPDGTQSSRIITTTTSENVAMTCCGNRSGYILKMEPLNDDDSRKIFFARVFGSESKCPQQFKDASYEIVRKCGGVPLAVIHIAGLLTPQQEKSEEWDYVERSLGSNLSITPTYEGMRKVINLSYNGLPQCLKTCLQYVCMYPENRTIWKDDLVRRWVAEGFIEGDRERDNEAIAQSHFEELVYRGMIQAIDMNYNDQVLSCIVHPMVLDFAISKSAEDNFITTVDYSKNARELSSKVRRLLLFYSSAKYAAKLSGMTLSQVRSLAFYGLVKCLPSIREFKFLRVLVLHLWGDHDDSTRLNLSGIDRLFQLKYLKVTCNFCVQLPTQMWGLNLLETLEINAKETSVPEDIVHLKYLAHLCLPAVTMLPYGMSRLRSLRTLKHFDLCGSSDEEVKSLKELSVLEELQLVLTTASADRVERNLNVLFSILWLLDNLKSLALVRGASVTKDSVPIIIDSSSMSCPTDGFERLKLHRGTCILRSLPRWIGQLGRSLCILKLGILGILKKDVDSLAGLQVLRFLSLYVRRPTVQLIIFTSDAFPALECFKFKSGVLCIAFQPRAMPKLRRLKLSFNAYSGVEYGHSVVVGIEHLLNLQEVSGRIGAAVGSKASDTRSAVSTLKGAISRHSMIPRLNMKTVDWIEDDRVGAGDMLSKMQINTLSEDHGFPGAKSERSIQI